MKLIFFPILFFLLTAFTNAQDSPPVDEEVIEDAVIEDTDLPPPPIIAIYNPSDDVIEAEITDEDAVLVMGAPEELVDDEIPVEIFEGGDEVVEGETENAELVDAAPVDEEVIEDSIQEVPADEEVNLIAPIAKRGRRKILRCFPVNA